jgi:hypothetical protein
LRPDTIKPDYVTTTNGIGHFQNVFWLQRLKFAIELQ